MLFWGKISWPVIKMLRITSVEQYIDHVLTKHGRIPIRAPLQMPVRGQNFSTSAGQNPPTCPENYPQQNQSRKNSANAKK